MTDSCTTDITQIRDYETFQPRKSVEHKYVTTKSENKNCDLKSMTVTTGSKDKNKTIENWNVAGETQSVDYDDFEIELTDEYAYTLPNENVTDISQNEDKNETTGNELKQQERQAGFTKCLFIVFLVILSDILVCGATIGIGYYLGHYLPNREVGLYQTEMTFSHSDAKLYCNLVELENILHVSSAVPRRRLAWIDASVEYTQWAEYARTYVFKNKSELNIKETDAQDLFGWCLENCNGTYFGLQDGKCACLMFSPFEHQSKIERLGNTKPCSRGLALCGRSYELGFAVFSRVDLPDISGVGNCLTYRHSFLSSGFFVRPCSNNYTFLCRGYKVKDREDFFYLGSSETKYWPSIAGCKSPNYTVTYSFLMKHLVGALGSFKTFDETWLGNIRSNKTISPSETNATYCLAVEFHDDGTINRVVRECTERLPALCKRG